MKIAFFGSSLVSALWNGAATYYRGLIRGLADLGHEVTFYEPDAFERQKHRDIDPPSWCRVVVWRPTPDEALRRVEEARGAELVVKASGVGVLDELLEEAVAASGGPNRVVAFWDVDAPATLARMQSDPRDPLRGLVSSWDVVFTYGGGPPVVEAYRALGARVCVPVYNAVDPTTHHPVPPRPELWADLSFLGNRLPDRDARVEEFFLRVALRRPRRRFLLGGSGWAGGALPPNVRRLGHVFTGDHNAFNCSPLAVLNVCRDSMARTGYSPATRVFEAAGAGACIVSDAWTGVEQFLAPGEEILVAEDGEAVAAYLDALDPTRARAIGRAARARVLAEHTYAHRARQVDALLGNTQVTGARALRDVASTPRPPPPSRPSARLRIVVCGLSITSSWGNGHATTYRGLARELHRRGHEVWFLERDVPWYRDNRDLPAPPYGRLALYASIDQLHREHRSRVAAADLVIVGSCVPDGAAVGDWVLEHAGGVTAFYDIDTPVTLAALEGGRCAYLRADQIPSYRLYLSFTGGPTLTRIEEELGSPCARPLYCSADPEQHTPPAGVARRWDLSYMGTYAPDRQAALERLLLAPARELPSARFAVAGPQYPPEVSWPPNVERIEHLPPPEHAAFYGASRVTLNLTRQDMVRAGYSPSVRLFEAAACASAVATDPWEGIETFFEPGWEILVVSSTADVVGTLAHMPVSALAELGARARRRVLAAHTAAHRAQELEEMVGALAGSGRSAVAGG